MTSTSIRDVALVSCVKSKRDEASPPRDLYTSTYFEKMRAYAEQESDEWWILSAKHGLLNPEGAAIEPYEETLNEASKAARQRWAEQVREDLQSHRLLENDVRLEIHAGKAYYGELLPLLEDSVVHEVEVPLEGLQIGRRLAWYNERL